jgi:DivIVA domain-containing protein
MPDQSSAANEHAIMQEITAPLAKLPEDPVAAVANQDFPVVLRGYDRVAVDAFVKHTAQLVAEMHATRSPEGATRRALERVGEEVSSILQRAHETAEQITATSRSEAEDRLARARQEAAEIVREAERRAVELDAEVDRIWAERDRIVADVRRLSEELELLAGAAATRFPAAAPEEAEGLGPTEGGLEQPEGAAGPAEGAAGPAGGLREDGLEPTEAIPQPLGVEPEGLAEPPLGAEPTEVIDDPALATAEPPVEGPRAGFPETREDQPTMARDELGGVVRPQQFRVIDLVHVGRERVIGCWQVDDVLIDPGPVSCLATLLDALGDTRPRALLLTHIHVDHAGAAGSLVERWPDLEVYVHERGAPHLMDPERLLESARRLYGEDMERLWGEMLPVPVENVRILRGGEKLMNGAFEVAYTPGHASHHVAYLHDDTAFVGDVAGVRITPETLTIPPTPPPDIDLEAWHVSIEQVKAWRPTRLAMTHFGSTEDVDAQLSELSERLDNWAALARTEELGTFTATVVEEIERDAGAELLPAYTQAAAPEQLYAGLRRYWDKRAESDSAAPAQASTHAGRSSRPPGPRSPEPGGEGEVF